MKVNTFQHLQQIRDKFGPGIFGKIAQKLLALAFREVGFSHIVERGVQGVDIDAANILGKKYALEVKTTDGENIPISRENIEALKDRTKDGYLPVIAALRVQMFEDWIFASIPLGDLKPVSLPLSRLRAYRLQDLETSICPTFEAVVNQHFSNVLAGGEHYLSQVLAQRRSQRH
jgi:Holliday junction resolvase